MATPPILPGDPEWKRLTPEMRAKLKAWVFSPRRQQYGDDLPCCWMDTFECRCRHYALRPLICRDFKVGSQACRDQREAAGLSVAGMPAAE